MLDNLMTLDIKGADKYEGQKNFVNSLKSLAKKYNLIVLLVAHPRKTKFEGSEHPTMYDVAGASEIVNLTDYILWTHKEVVTLEDGEEIEKSFIYLLKNRTNGMQDLKIRLNFSRDRKRFYENESDLKKDYGYAKHLQFTQAELQNPFEG